MKYRKIGTSDLNVSVIGLGGNTFGPPRLTAEQSAACIRRSAELGVNFIDTASVYGQGQSESFIGAAIAPRRHDWIIATKFNLAHCSPSESVRQHIFAQCDSSLKRLGRDYIDLFQIHFKPLWISDAEVLEVLHELVQSGKVRWVGECNYAAWRHASALDLAAYRGWPRMVSCQNHYNLLRRHVEYETLHFCRERQVAFLPYFPLAGGYLTDKYEAGRPAPAGTRGASGSPIVASSRTLRNETIQPQLVAWAHSHGYTLGELALAWLLAHPEIPSVIAGVSSPKQVEQNVRAADWVLSEAERAEVESIAAWDGDDQVAEMVMP